MKAFRASPAWLFEAGAILVLAATAHPPGGLGVRVESYDSGNDLKYVQFIRPDRRLLEVIDADSRDGRARTHNWNIIRLDRGLVWYCNLLDSSYTELEFARERVRFHRDDSTTSVRHAGEIRPVRIDSLGSGVVIAGLPTSHFQSRDSVDFGDPNVAPMVTKTEWWTTRDVPGVEILRSFQRMDDTVGYQHGGNAFPRTEAQILDPPLESIGFLVHDPSTFLMRTKTEISLMVEAWKGDSALRSYALRRVKQQPAGATFVPLGGAEVEQFEVVEVPDSVFELPHGLRRHPTMYDELDRMERESARRDSVRGASKGR